MRTLKLKQHFIISVLYLHLCISYCDMFKMKRRLSERRNQPNKDPETCLGDLAPNCLAVLLFVTKKCRLKTFQWSYIKKIKQEKKIYICVTIINQKKWCRRKMCLHLQVEGFASFSSSFEIYIFILKSLKRCIESLKHYKNNAHFNGLITQLAF